jgi:NitT/TauT family transport system substrate-binding protein
MLAAVAALIAGCWRNDGPSTAPKAESVTVAMPSGLRGALVLLAGEKRYFADQGLEVTLKQVATGAAAIDAVHGGQADLALSAETPFVLAVLDRKNVRVLARVYRSRTFVSMIARRDRGIARARDLAGKRIGIVSGGFADYFAELYLELQGIEPGQFTRVSLAEDKVEGALISGDVDAVATWHPYSTQLIARLGPQAIVFNDPAIYQIRFDLVARPDFAGSRPEVARRFFLALESALDFLRDNPKQAERLIVDATKEDAELSAAIWRAYDYTLTLDESLLSGLEDEARWALAKRATAMDTLPNFLGFIDARPLQSVQPDAVSILLP